MVDFITYDLSAEGLAHRKDLPERVAEFIKLLDDEPCQKEPELVAGTEFPSCLFESLLSRMCPVCRLKQFFYLTVVKNCP